MEGKKIVNDLTTDVNTKSKLDCLKDLVDTLGLNENEEWEDWGEGNNYIDIIKYLLKHKNYKTNEFLKIVQSTNSFKDLLHINL